MTCFSEQAKNRTNFSSAKIDFRLAKGTFFCIILLIILLFIKSLLTNVKNQVHTILLSRSPRIAYTNHVLDTNNSNIYLSLLLFLPFKRTILCILMKIERCESSIKPSSRRYVVVPTSQPSIITNITTITFTTSTRGTKTILYVLVVTGTPFQKISIC